jgi:DNA-binding HxlR family transcriptional regulator
MRPSPRPGPLAAALAARSGDLFASACPSRGVLDHVTSLLGVLVLVALLEGTHRFSELRRKVAGVSEKMLSQTLQALERDGFVLREAYPVIPPRVDYSLTGMGREVAGRVEALADWIEGSMPRIAKARARQDARRAGAPGAAGTPRPR